MSRIWNPRDSGNTLLDRLPSDVFEQLRPSLEPVALTLKQVIHESEADIAFIHFPTSALLSLLAVLQEDDPVEVATVGKEGFVGLSAALGVDMSPNRVICQMGGESLRIPTLAFRNALSRTPAFSRIIFLYLAFSLRSHGQSIACNALHSVEARASRWLLVVYDQAGRDEFPMTQEFMAFMLGVRRQTVTVVAGALQNAGLIGVRRGFVVIKDRTRLEEAACECYVTNVEDYRRIVG